MGGFGASAATSSLGASGSVGSRKAIRVLHVEDSEDDAGLVRRELQKGGYDVQALRVETAAEMGSALRERTWDLVISDHTLPSFSAPKAFALLRETGLDVPFIIVSGTVGEEVAVEAMRAGVNDYLLKGNLRRLAAAVERELRETAARAEQRRTQQQLMIAERMASVGTLAAGVAHEINNPLAVVMGNVGFALDELARAIEPSGGALPTGTGRPGPVSNVELVNLLHAPLADAQEAAERMRLIVRDLRVLSRADEDTRAPVDVRQILDSSVRMVRNEIRHRAQVVRQYGDIPMVECNEARLGQVFLNLLVNAAHAIPEGRAGDNTITLSARKQGARVVVDVTDTGSGIPADILPRIFDMFFTTKPIGVGTGLGLAICYKIVTGMKGEITVESQVGRGTTFSVALPRARTGRTRDVPVVQAPPTGPRRRARVLIVEDEEPVGRMLQRLLLPSHDAIVVTRARDALDRLDRGENFDLILCDLMMPEMTGMDVYAELAERGGDLARRLVFITGGAFTPQSREFLERVDNPRLEKPVDVVHLRRLVDELCSPRRPSTSD